MPDPPKLDQTKAEVEAMDDFDLCDHLWQLVVDEFYEQDGHDDDDEDPPCNYPESLFATELPTHWWVAYGVHAFDYDVLAGGLGQFLDNHRGLTNRQTAEAFRAIGQSDLADAFSKVGDAYVAFLKERIEIDRDLTDEEFEHADRDLMQLLHEKGKRFREIHTTLDLRGSLAKYIRANHALYTTGSEQDAARK